QSGLAKKWSQGPQPPAAKDRVVSPAKKDWPSAMDRYGDPLPPGAFARMGTVRLKHEGGDFCFSPDGKVLASTGGNTVRLWDTTSGKELLRLSAHKYYAHSVAFSPDGKTLASADTQHVHFWDLATGKEIRKVRGFNAGTDFTEPGKFAGT